MGNKYKGRNYLYAEFVAGRNWFDWLFLIAGVLIQIIVFMLQPDQPLAVVSGMAGIVSVILCSQGKISTYFFGFIQITTYLMLCLQERLYAEVGMNIFYFVSQIYGIYIWLHHYHINENQSAKLRAKRLRVSIVIIIMLIVIVMSALSGYLLDTYTNDSQPYLDAFTTVPAIVAQILLVSAYREQWLLWLMVDVLSAVMWARAGNYCLLAQYLFWCVNCIYGWRNWSK